MAKKQLVNRQIRSQKVLLIDHEGTNHGEIDTQEALKLAQTAELDLVVVSEGKEIPVAKVMDYGKHQYQQKKRHKQNTSKPSLKEVKLRPNVGESDYTLRIQRALQWLDKGDAVKFQVRLRGREHQHRDRAAELLERVVQDLGESAKVQSFDRRALVVQVVPS
ncbi:MAG: translation initiation factor IF-3 [Cyanobacteria bacterium J06635_15]